MSAIAWWVIPLVATFAAIGYVTWRSRPGPPEDTHSAIEARERFRRAIETGPAGQARPARTVERHAAKDDEGDADG